MLHKMRLVSHVVSVVIAQSVGSEGSVAKVVVSAASARIVESRVENAPSVQMLAWLLERLPLQQRRWLQMRKKPRMLRQIRQNKASVANAVNAEKERANAVNVEKGRANAVNVEKGRANAVNVVRGIAMAVIVANAGSVASALSKRRAVQKWLHKPRFLSQISP
jgi:hypothetical protein